MRAGSIKIALFFTFLLCSLSTVFAIDVSEKFEKISLEHGLSQSVVTAIYQDHLGFIWLGTQGGLNRYDGIEFTVYMNDPVDETSIGSNYISSIFEDDEKNLWITTRGGISKLDRSTGKFKNFKHNQNEKGLSNNVVFSAIIDSRGMLWVVTLSGLDRYNTKTGEWVNYSHDQDDALFVSSSALSDSTMGIIEDKDGKIWIATQDEGIVIYNPKKKSFSSIRKDPGEINTLPSNKITALFKDSNGNIWMGTQDSGVVWLDIGAWEFKHFKHNPDDNNSISHNSIISIYEDQQKRIWIGTNGGGVNVFNVYDGTFKSYQYNSDNSEGIKNNFIHSILQDRSGIFWFGTYGEGVNKFDPKKTQFHHFKKVAKDDTTLSSNYIWALYEDDDGVLWVGTYGGGLNKIDIKNNIYKNYMPNEKNPKSICGKIIYSIIEDSRGYLWLTTRENGICRFDKKREVFKTYRNQPGNPVSLPFNSVIKIIEDRTGMLWIASVGGGLIKFDPINEVFKSYRHNRQNKDSIGDDRIYFIFEDSYGYLWLATAMNGVDRFDPKTETFVHFNGDKSGNTTVNDVNTTYIYEDNDKNIWITTYGGGLNKYDRKTGTFSYYTVADGLCDNELHGVIADDDGNLWIITNRGLSKFNVEKESFINFNINDGLQGNEFNQGAMFKSKKGRIYIGGPNGFNYFNPREIDINRNLPSVSITNFKLFNKPVDVGKDSLLKKSILYTEKINLSYQDYVFSFDFAGLEFTAPKENYYAYKLQGFDKEWIYTDKRFATYTNIPSGTYKFAVKASNNHQIWNNAPKTLVIHITPPPWKTWWAYMIYVLLVAGFIALLIHYKTLQQKRKIAQQAMELEKEKKVNEEYKKINRMKDDFLANTSHELRTPLHGIIGIAESLVEGVSGDLSKGVKKNLDMIISSGKRLSHLINDILDFSKLKQQNIMLDKKPVDLKSGVNVVFTICKPLIGNKFLNLRNNIPDDLPPLYADDSRLQQILYNLIGNAIKFTDAGVVDISAELIDEKTISITVKDTGAGIPEEKTGSIFEYFEQADGTASRKHGGTGIGLTITKKLVELHGGKIRVDSKPDKGSVFTFTIPAYADDASQEKEVVTYKQPDVDDDKGKGKGKGKGKAMLTDGNIDYGDVPRILIVDDEPINVQVLINHLSMNNYSVEIAQNGIEALDKLRESKPFDLILLDIMMPGMSGYEVCKEIRKIHPANELPVILLTARTQVANLVEGFEAGANDYITKPFEKEELLSRIRTHIKLSKINVAYSRFVPKELLGLLDKESIIDVKLGDQIQSEMTVVFSDIRNFTSLSESMTPKQNFNFLNSYLMRMSPIIREYGGFIDKFIGDSIMSLFPRNPNDGIDASIEMILKLREYNRNRNSMGYSPIAIGIGVHTGRLMLGTIGEEVRMEGTVISDSVNLAARLEGLTKHFGSHIITTSETIKKLEDPEKYYFRMLGRVKVKGKERKISVMEILFDENDRATRHKINSRNEFELGVQLYINGKYKEAVQSFRSVHDQNNEDKAAKMYLDLIQQQLKHQIDNPDGVIFHQMDETNIDIFK